MSVFPVDLWLNDIFTTNISNPLEDISIVTRVYVMMPDIYCIVGFNATLYLLQTFFSRKEDMKLYTNAAVCLVWKKKSFFEMIRTKSTLKQEMLCCPWLLLGEGRKRID